MQYTKLRNKNYFSTLPLIIHLIYPPLSLPTTRTNRELNHWEMYIEGYSLVSSFSRANPYGGSCILVKDELESSYKPRPHLVQLSVESHVEISAISLPRSKLMVLYLYRSPESHLNIDLLNRVLNRCHG